MFALLALSLTACVSNDDDLGTDIDLNGASLIPQGKADPAIDNRIVELYKKYGTYFLYDFTMDEATWGIVGGGSNYSGYTINPADLNYLGSALDLLDETFLSLHEMSFLKQMLPLKIFLADAILTPWGSTQSLMTTSTSFVVGNMGETATTIMAWSKYSFCQDLNNALFEYIVTSGKVVIPSTFYQVSDYSSSAESWDMYSSDVTSFNLNRPTDEGLAMGFLGNMSDWMSTSSKRSSDVLSYLQFMLYIPASSTEWDRLLSYPLVKQKYEILRNAMINDYGFDPQHKEPIVFD